MKVFMITWVVFCLLVIVGLLIAYATDQLPGVPVPQQIELQTEEECSPCGVIVRNPAGKDGVRLSAGKVTNRVTVYNPEEANAVQLYADEVTNRVSIHNKVGIIRWEAP